MIDLSDGECIRCTFVTCELIFDGRPVRLIENMFSGCGWRFEGAAGNAGEPLHAPSADSPAFAAQTAKMLGLPTAGLLQ